MIKHTSKLWGCHSKIIAGGRCWLSCPSGFIMEKEEKKKKRFHAKEVGFRAEAFSSVPTKTREMYTTGQRTKLDGKPQRKGTGERRAPQYARTWKSIHRPSRLLQNPGLSSGSNLGRSLHFPFASGLGIGVWGCLGR